MSGHIDMIIIALENLNQKNGSSRQAIMKYIYKNLLTLDIDTDELIYDAIIEGVKNNIFKQPKGPSGPIFLVKEENKLKRKRIN